MASLSKLCLALVVPDAENPSWCPTCIYPEAWSTSMYPPTYCSEDDHPNKVRVHPFKRDSKWSMDTQSPGPVYEALRAPPVSCLLMEVDPFVGCLWSFIDSHVSHLCVSYFSAPVNLGEVNGWTWRNICWMDCMFLWTNFWCHRRRIFWEGVNF